MSKKSEAKIVLLYLFDKMHVFIYIIVCFFQFYNIMRHVKSISLTWLLNGPMFPQYFVRSQETSKWILKKPQVNITYLLSRANIIIYFYI